MARFGGIPIDDEKAPRFSGEPVTERSTKEDKGVKDVGSAWDRLVLGASDFGSTMMGDVYDDDLDRKEWPAGRYITHAGGHDIGNAVADIVAPVVDAGIERLKKHAPNATAWAAEKISDVADSDPARRLAAAYEGMEPESKSALKDTFGYLGMFGPRHMLKKHALTPSDGLPKSRVGGERFRKAALKNANKKVMEKDKLTREMLEPDPTAKDAARWREKGNVRTVKYNPIDRDKVVYEEVADIPGWNPRRSYSYNYQIVQQQMDVIDEDLFKRLNDGNGVWVNIDDATSAVDDVLEEVSKQNYLSGSALTPMKDIRAEFEKIMLEVSGAKPGQSQIRASDLLVARRKLDEWMRKQDKNIFEQDVISARKTAGTAVRDKMNQVVNDAAPDIGVKRDLARMHSLYQASDIMAPRVAKEAGQSAIGRYVSNLERKTGLRHPVNPQSAAITAQNPVVLAGTTLAAGAIGAGQVAGRAGRWAGMKTAELIDAATSASTTAADRAIIMSLLAQKEEDE